MMCQPIYQQYILFGSEDKIAIALFIKIKACKTGLRNMSQDFHKWVVQHML